MHSFRNLTTMNQGKYPETTLHMQQAWIKREKQGEFQICSVYLPGVSESRSDASVENTGDKCNTPDANIQTFLAFSEHIMSYVK